METLHVWYTDFWPEWDEEDFITPILQEKYNIVVDQKDPDVVFHSIFGNNSQKYKCKKILYVAENIRYPYNDTIRNNINIAYNGAHNTITFDPETDKNYRLPLWQVFILRNPDYWERLTNRVRPSEFERFCSFTVSNPSNNWRLSAYDKLSKYKRIHSYGKVRTNDLGLRKASEGAYWRDAKDKFFNDHPHKFSITFENTSFPYYCTEKLMDAFLAKSIPIYWGDPKVVVDWNLRSFVNAQKMGNSWADAIKKLDSDTELFNEMYDSPVFLPEQEKRHRENMDNFSDWLIEKIQ